MRLCQVKTSLIPRFRLPACNGQFRELLPFALRRIHCADTIVLKSSGDDTIKLFTWMDQLRAQADAAGGTVVSLLGNHEWMNVIGEFAIPCISAVPLICTFAGDWR
jgi:hypothetical protein